MEKKISQDWQEQSFRQSVTRPEEPHVTSSHQWDFYSGQMAKQRPVEDLHQIDVLRRLTSLESQMQEVVKKLDYLSSGVLEDSLEFREVPYVQAKEEIVRYFREHHGEVIYPSDVMEALNIEYSMVNQIFEELKHEGAIAETS